MKFLNCFFLLLISSPLALAQTGYWQQHLEYSIEAELNDVEKSITGNETIRYKNNSPDTLKFIWFHLWANAYKNDSTALFRQIRNDSTLKSKRSLLGYGSIEGLAFTVNNRPVKTEPHPNPNYIDVIKVLLNDPMLPGESVTINTPFKVKLPPYFSRSGYAGSEFVACQWYPKPAVYDQSGWHAFPYLDMGEFYSEYGDYQVSITLPSAYVVGATGTLLTKEELEGYKAVGRNNTNKRKKLMRYAVGKQATKTLRYHATQVPDFAWFADKDFIIQYDTVTLRSGKVIDAFSYFHDQKKTEWTNSIDYLKDAVRKYSDWIGEYEYPVVQAVEGPANGSSGGMEYPMITLITSPGATAESLDAVITHEVGHNWFMSMLGSNERSHTWMDEGMNTYFQFRYEAEKYRSNSLFGNNIPKQVKRLTADQFLTAVYRVLQDHVPMQSAMDIPADQFPNGEEYGIVSYVKTAVWMYLLESAVGREKTYLAVQNYFSKYKHKHPQPADMQAAFEEVLNENLDDFFELTKKEGKLN